MIERPLQLSSNVLGEIVSHNAGRDPERLAMKYAKLAQTPFDFLRGACHLFYDALPDSTLFREAPLAWCCGDAHFENFGSHGSDRRLVCFDINDYDESALAPATWDIVRLLTSIQCGADVLRLTGADAVTASRNCLEAYRSALGDGKPLRFERASSSGLVEKLLTALKGGKHAAFLDKRTIRKGGKRVLKLDGAKGLPASDVQKRTVTELMDRFSATQTNTNFFQVLDIGRRVAGSGSLGVTRFVVLVEGTGSPDGNCLLDIKEARPSAMAPHLARLGIKQPTWSDEANRVVTVQKWMQASEDAMLQSVHFNGLPCVLRELQAAEDLVVIGERDKKHDRLKEVVANMGRILAWDQLRAAGQSGSAGADALVAFAQDGDWIAQLLDAATAMTHTTQQQWTAFTEGLNSHSLPGLSL